MNDVALENMASSENDFLELIAKSGKNIFHNAPTVVMVSGKESANNIQAD